MKLKLIFITFMLLISVNLSAYQITARTPKGETVTLEVESHFTIDKIKDLIMNKTGYPTSVILLIYANKTLEDGRTLSDYNIGKDSFIALVIRNR